jgi:selenide, water dikinase
VPAERVDDCIAALKALGYVHTVKIGCLKAQADALEPIVLAA